MAIDPADKALNELIAAASDWVTAAVNALPDEAKKTTVIANIAQDREQVVTVVLGPGSVSAALAILDPASGAPVEVVRTTVPAPVQRH